ncbi:metal-sensing transcriptional repressor [Georgenia sp. AZ-5]|uniref:metal-sensing transcriptional repressor n=1 Tax=Georgenia sp. AZ-5 TaxID=3367526 RepID=UPI0037551AEC
MLQQIAAVNGALQNVAIGLLDEHVGHCVANAAGDQNKARDMVTEATQAIARIIKA